jgi:membrane associated rhomboid family serine protease
MMRGLPAITKERRARRDNEYFMDISSSRWSCTRMFFEFAVFEQTTSRQNLPRVSKFDSNPCQSPSGAQCGNNNLSSPSKPAHLHHHHHHFNFPTMSRRSNSSSSSERAKSALHLLILINILIYVIRDDLRTRQYLNLHHTYRIRGHEDDGLSTTIPSMLLSIFYHTEPSHLFMNMLALHRYGSDLFIHSSSRKLWQSVWFILISYLLCGMGAFAGIELISWYHDYQWEQKKNKARIANRCTNWLCNTVNDVLGGGTLDIASYVTNAWSDLTTTIQFADVKLSMMQYQMVYRIGASGVVYGWMGMRLITSWLSPYHSRLNGLDYFVLIGTLAHDLKKSPLLLEDLRISVFLEGDNIDHSAHLMGVIVGMIWACMIILCEKVVPFRWGSSSRGGRRLGTRWEDEQNRLERR